MLVQFAETTLAGTIGGASARIMVASTVKEDTLTLDEVRSMLDDASQVIAYSHELRQKSQELMTATSELRAANERLQELDRLKDDFISTVTHELRTPLTSIRAFSEILHDNPDLDAAEREKFLGIVIQESERLTRLINQVLDLAKLESGRAEWQVSRVDLERSSRIRSTRRDSSSARADVALEARLAPGPTRRSAPIATGCCRCSSICFRTPPSSRRPTRDASSSRSPRTAGLVAYPWPTTGPACAREDQKMIFEKFRQARRHDDGKTEGHRTRPAHQPADHRAFRRPALGRERAGRGRDVRLRASRRRGRPTPAAGHMSKVKA